MDWSQLPSSLAISEISNNEEKERLLEVLQSLVQKSLIATNRKNTSADSISALASTLELNVSPSPSSLPVSPEAMLEVQCEALKLLRNLCVGVPDNQLHIIRHSRLLRRVAQLAVEHFALTTIPVSMVAIQLLGNVCVGQPSGRELVWHITYPRLFRTLFEGQSSHVGVACMLLHYCTLDNVAFKRQVCAETPEIVAAVVSCLDNDSRDTREWSSHLISSFLSSLPIEDMWHCCPPNSNHRFHLLQFLLNSDPSDTDTPPIPPSSHTPSTAATSAQSRKHFDFCVEIFCSLAGECLSEGGSLLGEAQNFTVTPEECAKSALQPELATQTDFITVRTCHASLQLLCDHTQNHTHRSQTTSKSLTEVSTDLLKKLCELDGSLTSSRNLSQLKTDATPHDRLMLHPLYGFKRDLVRLLGNMLYECEFVQNHLREVGGVVVLLNLCTLDHRNPYITQWTVFAIRNLCQGNLANQQLIAGLKAEGVCPLDEEMLRASGGEVEIADDGRVKIKPK